LKASEVCGVAAINHGFSCQKIGSAWNWLSVVVLLNHIYVLRTAFIPFNNAGCADFLVCFHDGEAKRLRHFLKPDGIDFSPYLGKI
jgi:hypothetical protein